MGQSPRVDAEPATATVFLIGVLAGTVVRLVWDEAKADYLAIAFGYATPEPDAQLAWQIGRLNPAVATDLDGGDNLGQAYAEASILWDYYDPIAESKGLYYNFARIYKNGQLSKSDVGGAPPVGTKGVAVQYSITALPVANNVTVDMQTGKIGQSYDGLVGGGARFVQGIGWVPWDSRSETDTTVRAYLDGSLQPNSSSSIPSYEVPSVDELFSSGQAATNWFTYFLDAVSSAGTETAADGTTVYKPFAFAVPFSTAVDIGTSENPGGNWYTSFEVSQSSLPEPPMLALLAVCLAGLGIGRRRKHKT